MMVRVLTRYNIDPAKMVREMSGKIHKHVGFNGASVELFTLETEHGPSSVWYADIDSVEPLDAEARAIIDPVRAQLRLEAEARHT